MSCKLLHLKWIISYEFKLKFNKNLKRSFLNENGTFWNVVWICLEPHVGLWLIWLLVLQVQNLCRVVQCSSDNGISPVKMLKKQPHSKYHQFNPTTYCPTLTTHKGKFLIKTSFGKISNFFSELFFCGMFLFSWKYYPRGQQFHNLHFRVSDSNSWNSSHVSSE